MLRYEKADGSLKEGSASGHFLIDSTGMNILKGAFPAEWFEETIEMEFEGGFYPVPIGFDDYLRHWYGQDYMELPPEEKRNSGHDLLEVDLGPYETRQEGTADYE